MQSDFEKGTKKTIDISFKAEKITSDILKSALQEFIDGKAEKKGKMSYRQLENKSVSPLDSIKINDENIGDFINTARKYEVDFALKQDKSTEPPTYHVFFSAAETDHFKKAFIEYAGRLQKNGKISREQIKKEAANIAANSPKKQKVREKSRENIR